MIELSDLIRFVFDLNDTQDGLKCLRMEFIFYGKHLMRRIQASNQGPMCPLVLSIDGHMKKTSDSLVDLKGAVCTRIRSGKKPCTAEVGNVSGYRCVSDCRSRGREFDPGPVPYFRGD